MGIIQSCFLHCLKRCTCCICDCCYGSGTNKAFCTLHETKPGKTVFNDPFSLILYDKWAKQSEVYLEREKIFTEIAPMVINRNVVTERLVIDMGCGTGVWTESLCKTFMPGRTGKVICLDTSPQCLHYVRTRVVEKMAVEQLSSDLDLEQFHFEYFYNEPNKLCLETANYGRDDIDIVFMAFVLNHISAPKGDRHCIMKELFKVCRPGGHMILFEHGSEFMAQFQDGAKGAVGGMDESRDVELLAGSVLDEDVYGFESAKELQRFVEGYGFDCISRVMDEQFGDRFWLFVFEKPASHRSSTITESRSPTNSTVAKE